MEILLARLWLGVIMIKLSSTYLFKGKMGELTVFLESLDFPLPEI
jgi:hypothetical protein